MVEVVNESIVQPGITDVWFAIGVCLGVVEFQGLVVELGRYH